MKIQALGLGAVLVLLMAAGLACTATPHYMTEVPPLAQQYNSARDVIDEAVAADADPPETLDEAVQLAEQWSYRVEVAIEEMNEAYRALGALDTPERYQEHQQATLSAWRAGIEASVLAKSYFDEIANMRDPGIALVRDMNRLFAEEDRYQLEAKRLLEAAR